MANIIGLLHDQLCSLVRTFCALTEASWRYETDDYKRKTFIPADLWSGDNLGILVGVKLQKALLEMEMAYTQQNTRRLNITKTISLKSLVSNHLVKTDETALTTWDEVKEALKGAKLSFGLSHQFLIQIFPDIMPENSLFIRDISNIITAISEYAGSSGADIEYVISFTGY